MPRESSIKDRSRKYDSPDSSDSDYSQKSVKRKHKSDYKRSRSRERSYRRNRRSSSRSKKRSRRSGSRSPARHSKRRSSSRDRISRRRHSRSGSRERSYERSKSHSRERSDYSKGKSKKSSSSYYKSSKSSYESKRRSSSRSVSPYNTKEAIISYESSKKYIVDDTESKIEKAIKAAEAAGLTMCKLPSYEYKEVEVKEDMPTIQDRNVLNELNTDSFTPKQFTSSRSKKMTENIVIDLDAGTVKVPEVEIPKVESLFHPDLFPDEKTRMEKWVRKMFLFRQKALRGEI